MTASTQNARAAFPSAPPQAADKSTVPTEKLPKGGFNHEMTMVMLDSMFKYGANEKTQFPQIKKARFEKVLADVMDSVPEGCVGPNLDQIYKKWQSLKRRFQRVFKNNMQTTRASPMGFQYYNECCHLIGQNDATQPPVQISAKRITTREGDEVSVQQGPIASAKGGTQGQRGDPAATQAPRPRNLRPPNLRAPIRNPTRADKRQAPTYRAT
jgi:hypothetical protein